MVTERRKSRNLQIIVHSMKNSCKAQPIIYLTKGFAAARVALGACCKAFLSELGVGVLSHVVRIGAVKAPARRTVPSMAELEAIKGAHTAIRIARDAGRRLVIAGNRVDSPDGRAYWSNQIEPYLGSENITYVGAVDEAQKNDLLGRAAALLVPVEWEEPFGIVFAEALACGTPVISCPRGALPEIVRDGEHGFLVRSVAEGVAAVGRLPEIDRFACRHLAEQRFSRRVACDGYLAVYRELAMRVSRKVRP